MRRSLGLSRLPPHTLLVYSGRGEGLFVSRNPTDGDGILVRPFVRPSGQTLPLRTAAATPRSLDPGEVYATVAC